MEPVISNDVIMPGELLHAFQQRLENSGGVVSFTGQVRPVNSSGIPVKHLHLQAHPTLTRDGIVQAVAEANARWPLEAAAIHHRIGDIASGDTIVFVAAASAHRRAAFEAADYLMDYLKTRAVFWKKEVTECGAEWIEPRQTDHADFSRWTLEGPRHARH